jgi:hypothetical protein
MGPVPRRRYARPTVQPATPLGPDQVKVFHSIYQELLPHPLPSRALRRCGRNREGRPRANVYLFFTAHVGRSRSTSAASIADASCLNALKAFKGSSRPVRQPCDPYSLCPGSRDIKTSQLMLMIICSLSDPYPLCPGLWVRATNQ